MRRLRHGDRGDGDGLAAEQGGRRERCAAIGTCAGRGHLIIPGYHDTPGEVYQGTRCQDCAPDPITGYRPGVVLGVDERASYII